MWVGIYLNNKRELEVGARNKSTDWCVGQNERRH